MAALTPFNPFSLEQDFDDLFRGFVRPLRITGVDLPAQIKVDVTEKDDAYVVHAELPGVNRDDVQVSVDGRTVTISAEVKRLDEKKDGDRVLRSERYYGSVSRGFMLPQDLDESASKAVFKDGVLELTLAKRSAPAQKKLRIE
jgi:HSP20 family protein